jgi:restriction system protein
VKRRPRRTKAKLPTPLALLIVAAIMAFGSPAIGITLAALVLLGLWLRKPIRARRQLRRPARTLSTSNYQTMSPTQFEHALADLCRRDGCTSVRVVGGAGDLGADVIANAPDGRRLVIQAKRYAPTTKVGSGDVQKVGGTARQIHGADIAAVITTSAFTPAARDYCRQVGIRMLDGTALSRWVSRTGPAPWH